MKNNISPLLILALGASASNAAILDPNDPSISASLGLWFTDAGTQDMTSNDDFYLGDVRAGATSVPGFPATSTSDFAISQVIVFDSALTDSQIADVNEWMVTSVPEPGSTMLLGIAAIGLIRRRR